MKIEKKLWGSLMKEIEEILSQIDNKALESVSEPRKKLVQFLKEIYANENRK